MQHDQLKKIRNLSFALFASGTVNVLLIAFLFFYTFWERPPTLYCEQKPKATLASTISGPTNDTLLKDYKRMPYEKLIENLSKKRFVEDGFTERDLSLGVLTTFHEFNLEKALGFKIPLSKLRLLSFNNGADKVYVYPSLDESHFEKILQFIRIEKWPFKAQGLFNLLKKERLKDDLSLQETFMMSEEFAVIEEIFKPAQVSREKILAMLLENDFGQFFALVEKQRTLRDISPENRQKVLLLYLKAGSKNAGKILVTTDFEFATKRLSDETILAILRSIDEPDPALLKFVTLILASPRGDSVKELAINRYQNLTGKSFEPLVPTPVLSSNSQSIAKTVPLKAKEPLKEKSSTMVYVIQEGDSLWKIAKKFKVSVDDIRALNRMKTDCLKPGTPLKIVTVQDQTNKTSFSKSSLR